MPDTKEIVINTGPILALVAAVGDLDVLNMYDRVWVPFEVSQEVLIGGPENFAASEFAAACNLHKLQSPVEMTPLLGKSLDRGEAADIQFALNEGVKTVCIDEVAGRRIARLNDLSVTGSIGVLLRARQEGYHLSMRDAVQRMRQRGIWLSQRVVDFAMAQAGEEL